MKIKIGLWLDDIRPKPEDKPGYKWFWYTTAEAMIEDMKRYINWSNIGVNNWEIDAISLDNDLGEGLIEGYKVLDWLESLLIPVEFGIHIHSANPVARELFSAMVGRRLDNERLGDYSLHLRMEHCWFCHMACAWRLFQCSSDSICLWH